MVATLLEENSSAEALGVISKRFSMDGDLATWVDREAARLEITPSSFVSTLLEWARSEDISQDSDMMVFNQRTTVASRRR